MAVSYTASKFQFCGIFTRGCGFWARLPGGVTRIDYFGQHEVIPVALVVCEVMPPTTLESYSYHLVRSNEVKTRQESRGRVICTLLSTGCLGAVLCCVALMRSTGKQALLSEESHLLSKPYHHMSFSRVHLIGGERKMLKLGETGSTLAAEQSSEVKIK